MATEFAVLLEFAVLGCRRTRKKVRLYARISSGAKRRYVPVNKNKIYRDGTVFCLRYARRWETLTADKLTKQDLTDFVVAMKKQRLADRTIDNRLTDLGTFLHANNVALSLHQSYTEKKVRAYSIEELRALNGASTDEELQVWQFFLSTSMMLVSLQAFWLSSHCNSPSLLTMSCGASVGFEA